MRNNQAPAFPLLQQTNLIYEYKCVQDECEHLPEVSYVGLTTTTLSRRITMHLGSGAPKSHTECSHPQLSLSRNAMVENTKIIRKENDMRRLQIYEALIIQEKCPKINNQDTGSSRTLKLFNSNGNRGHNHQPRQLSSLRQHSNVRENPQRPPNRTQQLAPQSPPRSTHDSDILQTVATSQATVPSCSTAAEHPSASTRTGHHFSASQPSDKHSRGKKPSPRATASQPTRRATRMSTLPRRSGRIRNLKCS